MATKAAGSTNRIFTVTKTNKSVKKNLQEELLMAKEQVNIEIYKKLICDAVQDIDDCRFLKQLYAYICGGYSKQHPFSTGFDRLRHNN